MTIWVDNDKRRAARQRVAQMTAVAVLKAAKNDLIPMVRTADMGYCGRCGSPTSSGMYTFCQKCAQAIVANNKLQVATISCETDPSGWTMFRRDSDSEDGWIVSSVRVIPGATHDVVSVWNRGGLAGDLRVNAGDGEAFAALLLNAAEYVTEDK